MISFRSILWLTVLSLLLCLAACSDSSQGPGEAEGVAQADNAEFDAISTPPASGPPTSGNAAMPPIQRPNSPMTPDPDGSAPVGASDSLAGIEIVPNTSEPELETRTSPAGRWELILHAFGSDLAGLLVDITDGEDGYAIESLGDSPIGWTLTESEVKDESIHLLINDPQGVAIDFQGHFRDGRIRGNVVFQTQGLDLATLQPSNREALDAETSRLPSPGFDQVAALQQDENLLNNLRSIAVELGDAPLSYELYVRLFNLFRNQQSADWDLSEVIDEYIAASEDWGERVLTRTHLDVGYTLAILGQFQGDARMHIEKAAEGLGDNESEVLRTRLKLTRGLVLIHGESEEEQLEGVTLLQQINESETFSLVSTVNLAQYREEQGDLEQALALYASLATLPGVQGDISKIVNLWKELDRDPQELEAYLDHMYEETVFQFMEDEPADETTDEPAADNQRVVLAELFTGSACPPCVAADIATTGLMLTFPSSKFLLLRYHEHIPAPDPLTIAAGEDRAQFYEIPGTPSLYINGVQIQGASGAVFNAPGLYTQLRRNIEPLTELTTDLAIRLTAEGQGGNLHIEASVEGLEEYPETWRLRLCLVEEVVRYVAPNGIRMHEMIVRHMPGGAEGIFPEEQGFQYVADITAGEIRQQLQASFDSVQERYGTELTPAPARLDPLQLIAFLQDDLSLEVLQAASISVTGFNPVPAEEVETGEPAEESPSNTPSTDSADSPQQSPKTGDEEAKTTTEE